MAIQTNKIFSENISAVKLLSIITITFGHFWALHPVQIPLMKNWWIISAIGLLIFSITSGYFTGKNYSSNYSKADYWKRKLIRLGIPYTVINIFLLILFTLQGKEDLASVQTLASWLGIRGFWTWFSIPQVGPYGAGLWFLTTLLIFYALYPAIEFINRKPVASNISTLVLVSTLLYLDRTANMGHTLWLTASGFFIGVWASKRDLTRSIKFLVSILALVAVLTILSKTLFHSKIFSGLFMVIAACSSIVSCFYFKLPTTLYKVLKPCSKLVLGIYIIQMYLFVKPTSYFIINFSLSLLIIFSVSYFLDTISAIIINKIRH